MRVNIRRIRVTGRVAWIVLRLVLIIWMCERGVAFYYQGF